MTQSTRPRSFRLGLYDPLSESTEPLAYFGPPLTDAPRDVDVASRVIRRLNAVLASRPHSALVVGLFSVHPCPTRQRAACESSA